MLKSIILLFFFLKQVEKEYSFLVQLVMIGRRFI